MKTRITLLSAALFSGTALFAQYQTTYTSTTITGQLHLYTTTNLSQLAAASQVTSQVAAHVQSPFMPFDSFLAAEAEQSMLPRRLPPPPKVPRIADFDRFSRDIRAARPAFDLPLESLSPSLVSNSIGFNGMTHSDQRLANSGNQFSIEPPSPSIAVANGYVLEGVNNAVRVFSTSGAQLTSTIASNQLFGLAPAINRTTTPNVYGVYPTDMRVFFDQDISRWFVLQRAQDNDASGNLLSSSHLYVAVSQTADPTAGYNVYIMNTTDTTNYGCPCLADFPQVGADHYGFYINANEYSIYYPDEPFFNDAIVLGISKADLAAGVSNPTAVSVLVSYITGFEFAMQPATTPPGASPDLANGGVEFFVSSYSPGYENSLALWALSNTASLQSGNPNLLLTEAFVPTMTYYGPYPAVSQRPGTLTLGTTLEYLDAGYYSDSRVISTMYSGGRLYVTLASEVLDANQNPQVGGFYTVFSPTFRGGVLGATAPTKQGYLVTTNDNILRPAVAVNPQGRGVIGFTLVGPDYYPSAAYVSIDLTASTPSAIQIAAAGVLPEDGFSGYGPLPACPTCDGFGIARWGDYSTAVTSSDGSIWFATEYIPNLPRTPLANWGTFIQQVLP